MRSAIACLLTLSVALLSTSPAQAQAGRFIPLPRFPSPGGGGHSLYLILRHFGGDTIFWIIAAIIGAIVLASIGWHVGQAAGGLRQRPAAKPESLWSPDPTVRQATAYPPIKDLLLQPSEVAPKAEQTRRLMEFLAHQDRTLDPGELQQRIATTFRLVLKAWEARDYSSVRHFLLPGILAKHEKPLKEMRNRHEINRIEDLCIERFEFVHLYCPEHVEEQEVTALITFRASVYFVDDPTGEYTRGLRASSWFQELWIFRRRGNDWLLQDIEKSLESDLIKRANIVTYLTYKQLTNAQACIAL